MLRGEGGIEPTTGAPGPSDWVALREPCLTFLASPPGQEREDKSRGGGKPPHVRQRAGPARVSDLALPRATVSWSRNSQR